MWIVYLEFRGFLEYSLESTRPFLYRRHDVYSYEDSGRMRLRMRGFDDVGQEGIKGRM
jgi:hypothetical protein